ncbi:DUF1045 domain-containing protein [Sulfitobacter sp. F26204]|uniref:DUF1045 domain-containing protein n=1 Tax=Sulfitobacter sp. F26204 TaxID=2996014 RepID=UPI00225E61DD|nr:DUF1045 domain-containing protein [Sulfitobacter sp. F26204]MCX7559041.1 DUF1045 domain-containing protein [Sulfitobacter sp. F26204]
MFERYAIFYTPAPGAFADFGAAWLGWDSAIGKSVPHPTVPDLDVARLTARPRKYGFHGTLKAPFHLHDTKSPRMLTEALQAFAHGHPPVPLGALKASPANGFISLRASIASKALDSLAAAVVTEFDIFRAPSSQEDIERRRRTHLSPRQDQHMLDWGYPYVFEDFHFHMTLTRSLRQQELPKVLPLVQSLCAPVLPDHLVIDAVTLMGQDADGYFHQLQRATLAG